MTATAPRYRTNSIYYPKTNYLTSPPTMKSVTPTPKIHNYSIFSPPELVLDEEEEEEEEGHTSVPASPPSTPPSCRDINQQQQQQQQQITRESSLIYYCNLSSSSSSSSSSSNKRQKCIPHPSPLTTQTTKDRIFTWPSHSLLTMTGSTLSLPLIIQQQQQQKDQHDEPQPRIIFLRHRLSKTVDDDSPSNHVTVQPTKPSPPLILSPQQSSYSAFTALHPVAKPQQQQQPLPSTSLDPANGLFAPGRPARTKGPCQACHENSEACMRKAFDWPFPSDEVYYDKGRPFVYLCNKCGLRYNKSGGSVCRHCRWVLCKEEKRKVIQLIKNMQSSKQVISLDDDIDSFVCAPKYWHCGQPWKVRWIVDDPQIL